jgi:hypothetical protein
MVSLGESARRPGSGFCVLEHGAGFRGEGFAGLGETHNSRIAFQERNSKFLFQVANLPAERGLRYTELRSRLRKVQ